MFKASVKLNAPKVAVKKPAVPTKWLNNASKAARTVVSKKNLAKNSVLVEAQKLVPPNARAGFQIATAVMKNPQLTPKVLIAARSKLPPEQKKAFDAGVSVLSGMASKKAPPALKSAAQKAGFYLAQGIQGATKAQQNTILQGISQSPAAKDGAIVAAQEIKKLSWWTRVKKWFKGEKS